MCLYEYTNKLKYRKSTDTHTKKSKRKNADSFTYIHIYICIRINTCQYKYKYMQPHAKGASQPRTTHKPAQPNKKTLRRHNEHTHNTKHNARH